MQMKENWNATEDCLENGALYRLTFETTYDDGDKIWHASCVAGIYEDEIGYYLKIDGETKVERFGCALEPAVYRMHELVQNLTEE